MRTRGFGARTRAWCVGGAVVLASAGAFAQRRGAQQPKEPDQGPEKVDRAESRTEKTEELTIAIGESKPIPAPPNLESYVEPVGGFVDMRPAPNAQRPTQFMIVGLKPGSTTTVLTRKDGTQTTWVFNVFAKSPALVEREIDQLLEGMTGVRVRRIGSRFFLEGGVTSEGELRRIQQIASLFPGQVESLVVMGSGGADRKFNIRVDFYFVQYSRTSAFAIGLGWPTHLGANVTTNLNYDFLSKTTTAATAQVGASALPTLDIAASNGWAKVLRQSTVITTNGNEATFQNGGEENFPVTAGLSASVQSFQFGTTVKVLPRYDAAKREVEVKLDADVADIQPASVAGTSLPARTTSKLGTIVHLKLGQALILSGVRTQLQRRSSNGFPLLSEIPILGALFGTQQGQREDTEGAVFIIPSVVEAAPRGALEMVRAAMLQFDNYSGNIKSVNSFTKTPTVNELRSALALWAGKRRSS